MSKKINYTKCFAELTPNIAYVCTDKFDYSTFKKLVNIESTNENGEIVSEASPSEDKTGIPTKSECDAIFTTIEDKGKEEEKIEKKANKIGRKQQVDTFLAISEFSDFLKTIGYMTSAEVADFILKAKDIVK